VSSTLRYPRGNALTESMPFTARDGVHWLAYIEGIPQPRERLWHRATLPGRHLRFDSAAESQVTAELPAGSPFLPDERLQALLDQAHPVPLTPASIWQPLEAPPRTHRITEWTARARRFGQALGDQAEQLAAAALGPAVTLVHRIASGRRLKPR
jgi:hypothetical protein